MANKIVRTEAEWRARLSPRQYQVAREQGTEPAFTGEYWNAKTPGTYHCIGCGAELFEAGAKYDSGTGWPSFWAPIEAGRIAVHEDRSHGMVRTELGCAACGSHLGHRFDDGPPPTGQRYCINSASLKLAPAEAGTKTAE